MAELVILGGLALAGYALGGGGSGLGFVGGGGGGVGGELGSAAGAPPPPDDARVRAAELAIAQGAAIATPFDPSNAPIAGNRPVGAYSAGKQNFSEAVAQRKMELFTGAMNASTTPTGTWQHKKETLPFFNTNTGFAPVTSEGKGVGGVTYDRADYERFVSGKQNNVTPTPQIIVGPGIGIPNNQKAGNGFHYGMHRLLPANANAYRLNRAMPGRPVASGASTVPSRTLQGAMVHVRPDRFWTLERRPLAPGRATATAPQERSKEPRAVCFGTKRDPEARGYLGVATDALTKAGPIDAHLVRSTRTESRCDDPWPLPSINLSIPAAAAPRGAYATESFDCNRFIRQQREETGVQREGPGFVGGVTQNGALPETTFMLAPTKRALAPSFGCTQQRR